MIRTQVYIPDDLYSEAKLFAHQDKTTISHLIRDGLRLSMEKKRSQTMRGKKRKTLHDLVGSISLGKKETHIASTHNNIYDHIS